MKGLFCGLLTLDLHFFTDHYPDENSKIKTRHFDYYIGGPTTNAAITFNHLGGNGILLTAIGKNPFKSMVKKQLANYKLEFVDMKEDTFSDPAVASVITNQSSGQRTVVYHLPDDTKLHLNNDFKPFGDIAMFDGFYMEKAIEMAAVCRRQGIITVLDGGSWKPGTEELLKYIDIAICSSDFSPPGSIEGDDVASWLISQGVSKTAITRGEKPVIINEGIANLLVNVQKTEVVDTLGAGDILHGAFCYFYASGLDFPSAIEKASQIASFSCKYRGPRTWMKKHS